MKKLSVRNDSLLLPEDAWHVKTCQTEGRSKAALESYALLLQLPNLAVFQSVVLLGSMQATAVRLNLPRSSVSKKLAQLEQFLGQKLLHRTTRRLVPTEAGRQLMLNLQQLPQLLAQVEQFQQQMTRQVQGTLRISCSSLIGQQHVLPLLPEFCVQYPGVVFDLRLEDRLVDLAEEQVDIAIRVGTLTSSSLVARLLGYKSWIWAASPAYLAEKDTPLHPAQLAAHNCLIFKNAWITLDQWLFVDKEGCQFAVQVQGNVVSSDGRTLLHLACLGMGIIMVDRWLVARELASGQLVEILDNFRHPEMMPIYAVTPGRKGRRLLEQTFIDFLVDRLSPCLHQKVPMVFSH